MSVRNDDGTYHSQKVMNIEARPLELNHIKIIGKVILFKLNYIQNKIEDY